jgi:uncharacterized protein YodC (DUF2158 family)
MAKAKSNSQFKTGDIVQLKSGGPKMTVSEVSELTGDVHCQWFAGSKLSRGRFEPNAIELFTEEE